MLRNSLKIAWRNFVKDRRFTLLNLIGLATGMACAILVWLWINDERSVDQFNENDARLYQLMLNWDDGNSIFTNEASPGLLAQSLAQEYPDIEFAVPVIPPSSFDQPGILTYGEKHLEAAGQYAGKDFFNAFSFPLLAGDRKQVLIDPRAILLSRKLAENIFGSVNEAMGKTVDWNQTDNIGSFRVAGVFENPPSQSTLQFDAIFSYDLYLQKNPKMLNWGNNDPLTYIVLKKTANPDVLNKKIAGFIKLKRPESKATIFLQKFSEKYLHNHYENGKPSGGRIAHVKLFSIIAIFILVIACINFMNLATARAARRMKEVGIKKVMGAARMELVLQYMGESLLLSFIALFLAAAMVWLVLPSFNHLVDKHIEIVANPGMAGAFVTIALVAGLLAGSYPAFYLSQFNASTVLRGKWKAGASESRIRQGLVGFQFALSAIFILGVLVVYKQMQLIQHKNLGYSRDQVMYFEKGGMLSENKDDYKPGGAYEAGLDHFLLAVKSVPGVRNATNFRHNITSRDGGTSDISWAGKDPSQKIDFTDLAAGYDFVETLGIEMKEGRSFSRSFTGEKSKIVFNEAAIAAMGLKNPIGKTVHIWGEDREIIGVMKNFNFQSLHENLKPCFLDLLVNQRASKVMVKLEAGREQETLQRLEALYKQYNPGFAFNYRFLDQDYQALYTSENRVAGLSTYFAVIAIVISCLGLFGLAAFTAQKRQKEMGIRKVVGAGVSQIAILLCKDFVKPVLVAMLIAFPVATVLMREWLAGFAYRVNLNAGIFFGAGAAILAITLLTVSYQSLQTALENPVKSLRSE